MVWGLILVLCALGVAVFFQKEIRVAYHRNRWFAAMENYFLITGQARMPTVLEQLRFRFLSMSVTTESEAMNQHQAALIELGHLERREFWFTKRYPSGEGGSRLAFYQQVTNTFDDSNVWSCSYPATNKVVIIATPQEMLRWQKLIFDFDR